MKVKSLAELNNQVKDESIALTNAGFTNPFKAEAQALAVWCANCWTKAGELEALGTLITAEEAIAQMPIYTAGV